MTLVIMAAGLGSRYGGLKQIDPVSPHGEFIIDYSIYDAIRAGAGRVVFIILEENLELFRETIGRRIERVADVAYAFQGTKLPLAGGIERDKPWGTAHALWCAREQVNEPFVVINADDFYGRESYGLMARFLDGAEGRDYAMAGYRLENTLSEYGTVARGICEVTPDGLLSSVVERVKVRKTPEGAAYEDGGAWVSIPPDAVASMNFWGFTPRIFEEIEQGMPVFFGRHKGDMQRAEYYLPWAVEYALGRGARVRVLKTGAQWFGMTYREDKPAVSAHVAALTRAGVYPERLWQDG